MWSVSYLLVKLVEGLQDMKHKELKIFAALLQDDAKDNHQHKIIELQSIDLRLRAVLGKTAAC